MFSKSTVIAALIFGVTALTLQEQLDLGIGTEESMDLIADIAEDIQLNESIERRRHH
jgi:hypothetical protein